MIKQHIVALFILLSISATTPIMAQQDAQYTMYMFNGLSINPAYAGTNDITELTAIYRTQWVNFDGAPQSINVSGHTGINQKNGVGISLEYDEISIHKRWSLYGSYAYRLALRNGTLSLGIQAGFLQQNSDYTDVPIEDETDQLFGVDYSNFEPNVGLGAYYYTRKFYVGLSVPHLIKSEFDEISTLSYYERTYLLTSGFIIPVNYDVILRPSILVKAIPEKAPIDIDVNFSVLLQKVLWLGVSYRWQDSIDFMIEYQINRNLSLGYSYDYSISGLSDVNSGSHEVMFGYDFGFDDSKAITPRYF